MGRNQAPTQQGVTRSGGVAANKAIGRGLETVAAEVDCAFVAPPLSLCTDNAAMIAFAAIEQSQLRAPDDLTLSARPRWPLDTRQPPRAHINSCS